MSKSKYDNDFKKDILLKGLDREVAKIKREQYKESCELQVLNEFGEVGLVMVNGLYYDF